MKPAWISLVLLGQIGLFILPSATAKMECSSVTPPPARNNRAKIYRDILCEYDRRVPPQSVTNVTMALFIRRARVVESTLEMQTIANVWWEDRQLVWDRTSFPVEEIEIESTKIWTPDVTTIVTLTWERDGREQGSLWPTLCHVAWNGSVRCAGALEVGGDCSTSAIYWPRVDASCSVYIGLDLRTDSGVRMLFSVTEGELDGYTPGNDWVVTDVKREHFSLTDVAALTYGVKLRSHGSVHATALLGPGIALSTVVTASFCLPIASSLRLALCCCAILGSVISSSLLFEALPSVDGPTPIAVTSYCGLLLLSGSTAIITLSLQAILPYQNKSPVPPRWLYEARSWLTNSKAGKLLLYFLLLPSVDKDCDTIQERSGGNTQADNVDAESQSITVTYAGFGPHTIWDFFASFLNRCMLFVYIIICFSICIYLIFTLANHEELDFMMF